MKNPSFTRAPSTTLRIIALLAVSAALTSNLAKAASATWNALPTNNNWIAAVTTNNWSTGDGTFPGNTAGSGTADVATFSNASSITTVNCASGFAIGGITFDTANASAYTINTSGGTWRLNTGGATIKVTSTVVNPQVITGALRMQSSGTLTVTSDSTTPTATLSITTGIAVNNAGTGSTLILNGQNTGNNILGTYTEQSAATGILGNLTKNGSGTWILTGNSTYHSNTTINAGILMLIGNGAIPNTTNIWINSGTLCVSNTMVNPNTMIVTNGGTLLLTNTFFRTPLTIGTLTASNATFRVGINGATPFTNIVTTTSLNVGVNLTISIDQVAALLTPATFNLISYVGADPNPANITVTAPGGYLAGTPTIDPVNKLVQVTVTPTAPPVALTWQGSVSSGDWDTTTPNWTNFAGASVTYNQGDLVTFDDTAITTAVNLTAALSPSAFTNNTAATYTFGGVGKISGATSLMKQGVGTLIFTNATANDFNGGTTISAGTVQVGNGTTLGSIPASGGVVNNGALIFNRSDSVAAGGAISGPGTVAQNGSGTLTLSGNSTFTGGLTVNAGAVRANAVTAPGTGLINVNTGGTFVAGAAHTNSITLSNAVTGTSLTGGFTMNTNHELIIAANSTNIIYSADPQSPTTSFQFLVDANLRGSGTILVINAPTNSPDSGQGVRFRNTNSISDFSGTVIYTNGNKGELLVLTPAGGTFSPIGAGKLVLYCGAYDGGNLTTGPANGTGFCELNLRNSGPGSVIIGNDVSLAGSGAAVINALAGTGGITMGKLTIGAGQELIGYKAASTVTNTTIFTTVTLTGGNSTFSPHSSSFGVAGQAGTDFSLGNITEQSAGSGLTMGGRGNLTLTGANTYSGNTSITNGVLFLSGSASIATSPNIVVASNAIFNVSALTTPFALGAAQTLSNLNSAAVIAGNADASLGTLSLNYAASTPSFTIANGVLTLAGTSTVKVNNTGAALTKGSYKIISASGTGSVAGTVPSAVTVSGGGIATAVTPSLQITGSELFLVVPNTPPVIAHIVTNAAPGSSTLQIAISDLKTAAGWSDADNDTVTFNGVSPASNLGNAVTQDGTFISYSAPATSVEDFFTYTVTDGTVTTQGTVYIEVTAATPPPNSIVTDVNGVPTINFTGTPNSTNVLQASTNLLDWVSISTNVADGAGLWQVTDPDAINFVNRFYRSFQPFP